MKNYLTKISPECYCWILAFLYLGAINPLAPHFSFCLFHQLGISWCPGCGLGHSISFILHGNLNAAWNAHPLGFIAVPILVTRIITLLLLTLKSSNQQVSDSIKS